MSATGHDLYALPLAGFTAARNRLAAELRARGDREASTRVASLRKPSVAAWALNQLARAEARPLQDLFDAAEGVRAAHAAILGGGDPARMTATRVAHRAAAAELVTLASGILEAGGHAASATTLERVRSALEASVDPSVRDTLRAGMMAVEPAAGIDLLGGIEHEPAVPRAPAGPGREPSERQRQRVERLERDLAAARAALSKARDEAAAAAERSRRAAARAQEATRDAEGAARELERAERTVARAQDASEEAARLLAAARPAQGG